MAKKYLKLSKNLTVELELKGRDYALLDETRKKIKAIEDKIKRNQSEARSLQTKRNDIEWQIEILKGKHHHKSDANVRLGVLKEQIRDKRQLLQEISAQLQISDEITEG